MNAAPAIGRKHSKNPAAVFERPGGAPLAGAGGMRGRPNGPKPRRPPEEASERRSMSDYVNATEALAAARHIAVQKAALPPRHMLLRGVLAGAFLGYATSLVMVILGQGVPPIVGALCFP